jgi:cob(I)alamin adenosyltransferase
MVKSREILEVARMVCQWAERLVHTKGRVLECNSAVRMAEPMVQPTAASPVVK